MFWKKTLRCSFCGKTEKEVSKLVAGPKVYICDACVALADRIIKSASDSRIPARYEVNGGRGAFLCSKDRLGLILIHHFNLILEFLVDRPSFNLECGSHEFRIRRQIHGYESEVLD